MADEHSEPGGMKVLRLYADALGESRFETTRQCRWRSKSSPPCGSTLCWKSWSSGLKTPGLLLSFLRYRARRFWIYSVCRLQRESAYYGTGFRCLLPCRFA